MRSVVGRDRHTPGFRLDIYLTLIKLASQKN
jgi:hypothetical protein